MIDIAEYCKQMREFFEAEIMSGRWEKRQADNAPEMQTDNAVGKQGDK